MPGLAASSLFEAIEQDFKVKLLGWQDPDDGEELCGGHSYLDEDVPWEIPFTESDKVCV